MSFGSSTFLIIFPIVLIGLLTLAAGAFAALYAGVKFYQFRKREEESLDTVVLQIAVPRGNEIKIDAAEQMFSSLSGLRAPHGFLKFMHMPNHISLEIIARPEDIRFYIACSKKLKDMVEKQVHAAYPGAEVVEVNEQNIFTPEGKVAFAQLKLSGANYLPLKSYKELPTDPMASLTSVLSKMQAGEGAAIQILLAAAPHDWKSAGKAYVKKQKDPEKGGGDAKEIEAVENKMSKPAFYAVIRTVTTAKTEEEAKVHLDNIIGAFSQYASPFTSFKKARIWQKSLFMRDFIYRYLPIFQGTITLNAEELATLYHFPNKSVETPFINWLNAKRAPAPAQIPMSGLYLGKSVYAGSVRPIYVSDDDRRRHVYTVGKTGTGKSEFLKALMIQDIRAGRGLAFLDPHGDAAEDLLAMIPPERAEDVIYFDPGDYERPFGMNMLEANDEQQKHFVVNSIIGLMYKLFDPHQTGIIGPRFEHAIRNAMLTVMSEPGSTFVEVVRCLTDSAFVQELLPKVTDPVVRRYWTDQIAQTNDFHKSEVLDYITSKFGRFVTNKMMRNIIGQSQSSFNIRQIMDNKKILIVNLSKGKIGEENAAFLGLVLVPKILVAAMSRTDMPQEKRVDFYLYVDEFQNFATDTFAEILSEARKYRLNLIVANQFIGQMEEEIKNAIFGNVGTIVSFRVGVTDANYLQHEFQPYFSESDLINVERFNAYVRTIVNNEPVPAFSMDTTKDIEADKKMSNKEVGEAIRQLSRLRYGRDREVVEAEIAQRARL